MLHTYDRVGYVVHAKALKCYLELGLKLKKIHCGFKFYQEASFAEYIMKNVSKRREAKTESMKTFLKMMNNGIYGESLTNPSKF